MAVKETAGSVRARVAAAPDDVFDAVTDIGGLASWNDRIEALETPARELAVGDRWSVRMRLPGKRFTSASEVLELDRTARRFSYRSKPDDDNPSHTIWTWEVAAADDGDSEVLVSWSMRPATLDRRLAAALRKRMIPKEVTASIGRLATVCADHRRARD
jgi:uncharacterized protein YndB with AHSA1/START domain